MKELGKWQVISILSQGLAMFLGLVQTFVIIRILSVEEWGVVQLAVSIGGALGIYQHLGLVSASTREISSARDDEDIFKIFITSSVIRYFVTLPIAIGLFFFADHISVAWYKNAALTIPLQIYGVTLLFQGVQGILNSVISGTQRFKALFIYQIMIAFVSVLLYIPFVYFLKINGFFYAFLAFNIISSIVLAIMALKPLRGKIRMPSKDDFKRLFKDIFSISIAIYVVKILYTNWEKFGSNALGLFNSVEVVAIFAFAMLYAKKLMSISDSVTTVNIPVFSDRYVRDFKEFKELFEKNFNKLFSLIVFTGAFASYFAPTIVDILVGGNKYDQSLALVPAMMFTFIIYSFINLISASVMIPAKMAKSMILSYVLLMVGSVVAFFSMYKFIPLLVAVSWAMTVGTAICLAFMVYWVGKRMKFWFFNLDHVTILVQALFISLLCNVGTLPIKLVLFVPFSILLGSSFFIARFVSKEDFVLWSRRLRLLTTGRKKNG